MPQPLTLIVNVFKFFDRKDLEIVSTSAKHANRIVRKHFPSKPYRFLNDIILEIRRDEDGLAVALLDHKYGEDESSESQDAGNQSSGSQDAEHQSSGVLCFNPYKNEWMNGSKCFALEVMRPYLSQFVRFGETELYVDECSYTPEDMTILASISHVWSGQPLWLSADQPERPINFPNNISYSLHNILTNDAIFSIRCLALYEATEFVSLHDYSRVYTVDVLFLKSFEGDPLNMRTLLALIEHNPQFPESKTVFVLNIVTFETQVAEVTDAICKSFSSASTPCPFQLVIIDLKDFESNGDNEEFLLENETTREVLQLKNVEKDSPFVTKLCEAWNHKLGYNTNLFCYKFILIKRSRL